MAAGYEKIIEENSVPMFGDYAQVKAAVMAVKAQVDSVCDIQNVPCHNDPLCENWVVSADDDRLYLIDWEYAGMNDGIWDLADVSIEGVFTPENDELLLTEYLGSKPDQNEYKHFLANKIYVDYLWTLWAKTRVPYDGQPMEDWAVERYARLKDNLRLFAEAWSAASAERSKSYVLWYCSGRDLGGGDHHPRHRAVDGAVCLDRAGDFPRAVCEHLHPRRVFRALGDAV